MADDHDPLRHPEHHFGWGGGPRLGAYAFIGAEVALGGMIPSIALYRKQPLPQGVIYGANVLVQKDMEVDITPRGGNAHFPSLKHAELEILETHDAAGRVNGVMVYVKHGKDKPVVLQNPDIAYEDGVKATYNGRPAVFHGGRPVWVNEEEAHVDVKVKGRNHKESHVKPPADTAAADVYVPPAPPAKPPAEPAPVAAPVAVVPLATAPEETPHPTTVPAKPSAAAPANTEIPAKESKYDQDDVDSVNKLLKNTGLTFKVDLATDTLRADAGKLGALPDPQKFLNEIAGREGIYDYDKDKNQIVLTPPSGATASDDLRNLIESAKTLRHAVEIGTLEWPAPVKAEPAPPAKAAAPAAALKFENLAEEDRNTAMQIMLEAFHQTTKDNPIHIERDVNAQGDGFDGRIGNMKLHHNTADAIAEFKKLKNLAVPPNSSVDETTFNEALKSFQTLHGLKDTGTLNEFTLKLLKTEQQTLNETLGIKVKHSLEGVNIPEQVPPTAEAAPAKPAAGTPPTTVGEVEVRSSYKDALAKAQADAREITNRLIVKPQPHAGSELALVIRPRPQGGPEIIR